MKFAFITLVTLLHIGTAQANTYICREQVKPTIGGARIQVVITETAKLPSVLGGKQFDAVHKVDVVISAKVTPTVSQPMKNFSAISTTEDVVYKISSVKANGVKLAMFFDEPTDSWMELSDQYGNKRSIKLDCDRMVVKY